jgi:FKBP-type peptidyl-prolyl cis-trans isomerase 2
MRQSRIKTVAGGTIFDASPTFQRIYTPLLLPTRGNDEHLSHRWYEEIVRLPDPHILNMVKNEEVSWWPVVIVTIIVIAAGAGASYVLYAVVNKPAPASSVLLVKLGDNVTVNYTGIFLTGFDSGKVFDTSLFKVATDNASFPKAISFGFRGKSGYSPLGAHVGSGSYDNGTYASLIPGFWQALIGHKVGDTFQTPPIPPSRGYGNPDPTKFQTLPLVQYLPMVQTYSLSSFSSTFSGITAQTGVVFTDPHYSWPDLILSKNQTSVVVEYQPSVGEVVEPFGWQATVTNVTSTTSNNGTITVVNNLTAGDVGHYKGTNWQNSQQFFLSAVNTQAGTYTLDYNEEVIGNVLLFTITIATILPPVV